MNLGQTGQYPYRAVEHLVAEVTAERPQDEKNTLGIAQSLVSDAYSFFQRGSEFEVEDDDFVEFLQTLHASLSPAILRQGLELAVDRLLDDGSTRAKPGYLGHIQTEKGTAIFRRRQDALLFNLLPLVREVDPAWADQIIHRAPELGQAEGNTGKEIMSEAITTPGDSTSPSEVDDGLQRARADEVGVLAQTDPGAARRLAQTIGDPSIRVMALANLANAVGSSAPGEAGEIETSIKDTVPTIKEAADRLQALSALAKAAAAAGDTASLSAVLDRCFALGEELFEEDLDVHPLQPTYASPVYDALSNAVRSGASVAPAAVASKVHDVGNTALRAYLLYSLAEALYTAPPKSPAIQQ